MVNKKVLFLVFVSLFLVYSSFLVSATTTLVSPIANGNYSTLIFNCTTDISLPLNATLYYNATGGAATEILVTVVNGTQPDTEFSNISVNFASLSELNTYNMTCAIDNSTDIEYSTAVASVTLDATAPVVDETNIASVSYSTQSLANGTFVLNVSITDTINATTVFFNLTNASGVQDAIYYAARDGVTNNWINSTGFNISDFTEGAYTITVYATDSAANLNSSESSGTIYIDNTSPSAVTLTQSSRGSSSLNLAITITEATSGVTSSCTLNRAGASVTGTSASQTITETGLSCGNSYSYIATCTDRVGNSKASASTSFTTNGCGSSGTTSSTTSQWTNTYVVTNENFKAGYSRELGSKQRMKVMVGSQTHYVGVKDLTATSATIEITSDPVTVVLVIGGETKVDVTNNGFYDVLVKLIDITNNKAEVSVQEINEQVLEGEGSVTTTGGEVVGEGTETTTGEEMSVDEESSLAWLWWIIGIIIVLGIAWFVYQNKKK